MSFVARNSFDALDGASLRTDYVTVFVDGQRFGLEIGSVHDVFMAGAVTKVPLAPPAVAGLINLRGRVVTAICMRRLLRLPTAAVHAGAMVVGIERAGESFGVIVDSVGEVIGVVDSECQANPLNLDPRWAEFSKGIHWLPEGLLVVLDIDAMLSPAAFAPAPAPSKDREP
jgi:purine-binding chemotaxis protein CheW